jgi:hypothetical protein
MILIYHKIKSMSDIVINDRLKFNYKILIKDNSLKFPLRAYYHIHKIYGRNFTREINKLQNLICLIVFNDNIELIDIIYKTVYDQIKPINDKLSDYYITDSPCLWVLYLKLPNQSNKTHSYDLRNNDNDYIKFKTLIYKFVNKKI